FFQRFLAILVGRVRHENVELAELLHRRVDDLVAELGVTEIAFEREAASALVFDGTTRFLRIRFFRRKMAECDVRAFAREQHGNRAPDPGSPAGDERDLALELSRRAILFRLVTRARIELRLDAGL